MERFHVIEEATVITSSRGVYKQCKVYRRGEDIYAGVNGGYVKLFGMRGTSSPNVSWWDLDAKGVEIERGYPKWRQK